MNRIARELLRIAELVNLLEPDQKLFHGTPHTFDQLKPNGYGIIWLAPDAAVAKKYSEPYWNAGHGRVIAVTLSPKAKVVNLKDLSNPIIRELKEQMSEVNKYTFGAISDESWVKSYADFGVLEVKNGLWTRFLKSKRVDAVVVADSVQTSAIKHESVAVLNKKVLIYG